MRLKHTFAMIAVCTAVGAGFSTSALAQAGMISFDGRISASGCTPNVAGQGPNAAILLPWADATDFPAVGDTMHWTPFAIEVTGCTITTFNRVWSYFSQGTANVSTGRLDSTGSAGGVDLQLTDGAQAPFAVWGPVGNVTGENPTLADDGSGNGTREATMNYGVRYYRYSATAPTPGSVISTVQYSLQFN